MWLWTGTREVCNWYGRPQGDGRERPSLRALFCWGQWAVGRSQRVIAVRWAVGRSQRAIAACDGPWSAVPPPGETFGTACKEELYEN